MSGSRTREPIIKSKGKKMAKTNERHSKNNQYKLISPISNFFDCIAMFTTFPVCICSWLLLQEWEKDDFLKECECCCMQKMLYVALGGCGVLAGYYCALYVAVRCLFSILVCRYGLGTSFRASLFFAPFIIQQMEIVSPSLKNTTNDKLPP